jgi:hypothetical protein
MKGTLTMSETPEFLAPIPNVYGGGLTVMQGPMPRLEPVRVPPKQLTKPELLKRLQWTDEDLVTAQTRHGFPEMRRLPIHNPYKPWESWRDVWQDDIIDLWEAERRAQIAELSDLLNRR